MIKKFYLFLMLWSAAKIFPIVSVYAPDEDDENVRVIHFAENEEILRRSCQDYLKD